VVATKVYKTPKLSLLGFYVSYQMINCELQFKGLILLIKL
jgi:hypothetical protein